MQNNSMKAMIAVLVVAVVVLAGVVYHQANRPRTPGEAIDNAIHDVGDAVEDAGDKIQDSTR